MLSHGFQTELTELPPPGEALTQLWAPDWKLLPQTLKQVFVTDPTHREVMRQVAANQRMFCIRSEVEGSRETVACLTRLVAWHDDTSLAILRGCGRVLLPELTLSTSVANYRFLADYYPVQPTIDRVHRRCELLSCFFERFPRLAENDQLTGFLHDELPLGGLCDLLCGALPLEVHQVHELLQIVNVDERSEWARTQLLKAARLAREGAFRFPAFFSDN